MWPQKTENIYTLDLNTGSATLVGTDINYNPTGMTCAANGTLYAIDDAANSLFTVDRTTGIATLVGALGINIADGGLSRNGSQLLMVVDESPTNLYEVNSTTGVATIITQLDPDSLGLEGLSVDANNNATLSAVAIPTITTWGIILLISGMLVVGLFGFSTRRGN